MSWYIKTEVFNKKALNLSKREKSKHIREHSKWVKNLKEIGLNITSGYLINKEKVPGGGGLLALETDSYEDAHKIIKTDPMIKNKLVSWELHEWVEINTDN